MFYDKYSFWGDNAESVVVFHILVLGLFIEVMFFVAYYILVIFLWYVYFGMSALKEQTSSLSIVFDT